MSIVVQCPHCDTKFNLQPDMIGKSMRCPNLDCRQVFTVQQQAREIEPPKSEPVPVPAPRPLPPEPGKGTAPPRAKKPHKSNQPGVVDAKIVEAAVVSPPKVKEVVWSEGANLPPPGGSRPVQPEFLDETDDQPILRRKKKKNRGPIILIGLVVASVLVAGAVFLYVLRIQSQTEQKMAQQAEQEYEKGDYAAAAKSFEKLVADYPNGEQIDRYRFFADLAGMQIAVRSVTNRENPQRRSNGTRSSWRPRRTRHSPSPRPASAGKSSMRAASSAKTWPAMPRTA